MKSVKILAILGSMLALSIGSSLSQGDDSFGRKGGCHEGKKCKIPNDVYRLTNPLTGEDRFEVVMTLTFPEITLMVHDKTLDKYYLLAHKPPHRKGPPRPRHHINDNELDADDNLEISEMRGGRHKQKRHQGQRGDHDCHKEPRHPPDFDQKTHHPRKGKHPCKGVDLKLVWDEKQGTSEAIKVDLTLVYSESSQQEKPSKAQMTGTITIKTNSANIADASVVFTSQSE